MVQSLWPSLTKLDILFPCNPAITLVVFAQRSWKLCPYRNPHIHIYKSFILQTNELSSHEKTWRKLECILLWKKTMWNCYLLHNSNNMTFCKTLNYGDRKKIRIARAWKGGCLNWQKTQNFKGSTNTWYGIIMMDISNYKFVQAHKMYNTKSES